LQTSKKIQIEKYVFANFFEFEKYHKMEFFTKIFLLIMLTLVSKWIIFNNFFLILTLRTSKKRRQSGLLGTLQRLVT